MIEGSRLKFPLSQFWSYKTNKPFPPPSLLYVRIFVLVTEMRLQQVAKLILGETDFKTASSKFRRFDAHRFFLRPPRVKLEMQNGEHDSALV